MAKKILYTAQVGWGDAEYDDIVAENIFEALRIVIDRYEKQKKE